MNPEKERERKIEYALKKENSKKKKFRKTIMFWLSEYMNFLLNK